MLLAVGHSAAQEETGSDTDEKPMSPGLSLRADSIFRKLKPTIDSTYLSQKDKVKENFWTRVSFQTNMIDWMLTLPNVGIEYDLRKEYNNKRSLFLNVKYNGTTPENHSPKFVFNYMQVRGEYRKYWRTGNIGKLRDYPEYRKITLLKPDSLYRDTMRISYPSGDTIYEKESYVNPEQQRIADAYNGDPYRGWFYNHWHKARRRISTRTITNPRNWRAYYLGAYALVDKYSICFDKKGNQGTGIGFGATAGWSIPLLPNRFPKEGGLDLDLGVNVGMKMVRNEKYRYNEEFRCFWQTKPANGFSLFPGPVVDEVRIALVYRFRSIAYKVDLSIVDDYKRVVDRFKEKSDERRVEFENRKRAWESKEDSLRGVQSIQNDSLSFWVPYHKRRLKNAWTLNPDTVFHERDSVLEAELFPDSVVARVQRKIEAEKQKKIAAKEEKRQSRQKQPSVEKQVAEKPIKKKTEKSAKKKGDAKKDEEETVPMETTEPVESTESSAESAEPMETTETAKPAEPEEESTEPTEEEKGGEV